MPERLASHILQREFFSARVRKTEQRRKAMWQFGEHGMGTGPEDPEDPSPQRMRDMSLLLTKAAGMSW